MLHPTPHPDPRFPKPPLLPPQLLALLKSSAPYVRTEADWRTVCAIIKLTSGGVEQGRLPTKRLFKPTYVVCEADHVHISTCGTAQLFARLRRHFSAPPQLLVRNSYLAMQNRKDAAPAPVRAVRPEAAPLAYESLSVVCSNSRALSGESYLPLLEMCLQYLERYKQVGGFGGTGCGLTAVGLSWCLGKLPVLR